jgi:apolipoprotein N-acyltransferase
MMSKKIQTILYLLTGAVGIIFSGISWHNCIAAWITPIFLLLYSRNAQWKEMWLFFVVLSVAGAISQIKSNLMHIPLVYVINGISYGILTVIPYIVDKLLYKKNGKFHYTLIFPASIAIVEFLANFIIGTWGSTAHTQYPFKPLMQLGSIFGIYSIWFLIAWFASIINWIVDNKSGKQSVKKGAFIFGGVFIAILVYGTIRTITGTTNIEKVKVAAVIGDSDIHDSMDIIADLGRSKNKKIPSQLFSDSLTIRTLLSRTNTAISNHAKIVAWNEAALVLTQKQKEKLISEIQNICKKNNIYILTAFIEECTDTTKKPFNNISIIVSSSGKTVWEYKKSYLEYSAEAPVVNSGNYDIPVVKTEYGTIGNVICADLDMQHYIKQVGQKSIDILLVPGFDWPGITPLHTHMAAIHSIQFGCNIIRSNGKGLSAMYDYKGKEIASMNSLNVSAKILYGELPVKTTTTFYAFIGDLLITVCVAFVLLMIFVRIIKTSKKN